MIEKMFRIDYSGFNAAEIKKRLKFEKIEFEVKVDKELTEYILAKSTMKTLKWLSSEIADYTGYTFHSIKAVK